MTTRRMIKGAGKSSYVSKNRGLALLDEAIEQVELQAARPGGGQWEQGEWRCETGMCLAGWISQLAGGTWAYPATDHGAIYMIAEDGDPKFATHTRADGKRVIDVADRASRLLGLSDDDTDQLFSGENDITDLHTYRDDLVTTGIIK